MDHTYYQEEDQDHEYSFGEKLLKDPNAFSGFFAKNIFDAYVCHIGIRDNVLINSIKDNNFIAKQYEHRKR